jgi:hypothetical protein
MRICAGFGAHWIAAGEPHGRFAAAFREMSMAATMRLLDPWKGADGLAPPDFQVLGEVPLPSQFYSTQELGLAAKELQALCSPPVVIERAGGRRVGSGGGRGNARGSAARQLELPQ